MQAMFLMMMLAVGADQIFAPADGIPVPPTPVLVGGDSRASWPAGTVSLRSATGSPGGGRVGPRVLKLLRCLVETHAANLLLAALRLLPGKWPRYLSLSRLSRLLLPAAYNYRPLFEYPWQADMHEPLPLEVSGGCPVVGGPPASQPQRIEVITTPPANLPHWQP